MNKKNRVLTNKILVIAGPTATGKTDLGILLAKKFNGEIVSCDSRQVYMRLDIGTGKNPSKKLKVKRKKMYWEVDGVKIWMYDVVSPKIQYTVASYVKDAEKIIKDIQTRGKLPIIVGGTGLYLRALLDGLPNLEVPVDPKLRKKLQELSVGKLQEKLQRTSISRWEIMNQSDRVNPRRLIRAIELEIIDSHFHGNDKPLGLKSTYEVLQIGLIAKREILYQRVDERVVSRIKQGIINEAEKLQNHGLSLKRMRQLGLEYGVLADYLEGKIKDRKTLIITLQKKIHGYVRRQLTWFKKEKNITWFDITNINFPENVEKEISKWYHLHYESKEN